MKLTINFNNNVEDMLSTGDLIRELAEYFQSISTPYLLSDLTHLSGNLRDMDGEIQGTWEICK